MPRPTNIDPTELADDKVVGLDVRVSGSGRLRGVAVLQPPGDRRLRLVEIHGPDCQTLADAAQAADASAGSGLRFGSLVPATDARSMYTEVSGHGFGRERAAQKAAMRATDAFGTRYATRVYGGSLLPESRRDAPAAGGATAPGGSAAPAVAGAFSGADDDYAARRAAKAAAAAAKAGHSGARTGRVRAYHPNDEPLASGTRLVATVGDSEIEGVVLRATRTTVELAATPTDAEIAAGTDEVRWELPGTERFARSGTLLEENAR